MNDYKVIIIGCGVAGMTAAIYLKRAGVSCVILEKSMPGGQIVDNGNILNYPGFSSISGSDLALNILSQVNSLDIPVKYEEVLEIKVDNNKKKVITSKSEYVSDYIIIATGRNPKMLGVRGEKEFRARGISYCAVCDGSLYKDKEVVVIGASDSAFEGAIYLSKLASKVTILYRNSFRAKSYLQDMVKTVDNINFVKGEVDSFEKDDKMVVKTKDNDLVCDGVFIYVGQVPNASFVSNLDILDDKGYILVDSNLMTSIDGIYAVGDSLNKLDYQIVIAMGEAAKCALEIVRRFEV